MPYLLALDLDGTTVNRQGKLGLRTKAALLSARARGHLVVFATGRRDIDMFSFWEESRYADYLLLNNGAKLMRTDTKEVLFNHVIAPETAKQLIEKCLKENWQLHVTSGDYWAINKWNDGLQSYIDFLGTAPTRYAALEDTPWQQVEGFMATADLKPICRYIDEAKLPLAYTLSEDSCVDIMTENISKCRIVSVKIILIGIGDKPSCHPQYVSAGEKLTHREDTACLTALCRCGNVSDRTKWRSTFFYNKCFRLTCKI
jgi:hydroxymethylpyrimidine pyrophosphatase-like HAD family hydrolase